jgi:hypothetical protein
MTPPYFPSNSGCSCKIKTLHSTSGFLQVKQKEQANGARVFSA